VTKIKKFVFSVSLFVLFSSALGASAFVELTSGYNIAYGKWRNGFGNGLVFGGLTGFSFSEYLNPAVGGFIVFPKTGKVPEQEYKNTYETDYVSLFTVTGFFYIENRMEFALSESVKLSVGFGLGILNQRDYVSIVYNNFESSDNFSGFGFYFGWGIKRRWRFSVFDYVNPFVNFYYSPNRVYYHVVDPNFKGRDLYIADEKIGIIIGISLISFGKE